MYTFFKININLKNIAANKTFISLIKTNLNKNEKFIYVFFSMGRGGLIVKYKKKYVPERFTPLTCYTSVTYV